MKPIKKNDNTTKTTSVERCDSFGDPNGNVEYFSFLSR